MTVAALLLAAAAAAGGEPAAPDAPPAFKPDTRSEAVLRQCAAAYRELRSYAGSIEVKMALARGDERHEVAARVDVLLARPNRAVLRLESKPISYTLVCDGRQFWACIDNRNQYVHEDAPDTLDPLLAGGALKGTLLPVFGAQPYEALTAGATSADYVAREDLNGQPVDHLRLRQTPTTVDLWISADDHLVRRIDAEARNEETGHTSRLSERHFVRQVNAEPKKTDFRFRRPAGAAQVERFTADALVGRAAPDITAVRADDKPVSPADLRGKALVVDFWAGWSAPCSLQLALLEKLRADYEKRGVRFMVVNVRDSAALVDTYRRRLGLGFDMLQDPYGLAATACGVESFPQMLLIDAKGVVIQAHAGVPRDLAAYEALLRRQLDGILGEK